MTPLEKSQIVLARSSVMDLTELRPEDITRQVDNFGGLELIERGNVNSFFKYARVKSGENIYEVRLFETWMYCECPAFFWPKDDERGCKHSVFAFSEIDARSYHRIIDQEKFDASFKEIRGAIYAPVEKVLEKKGGIPL